MILDLAHISLSSCVADIGAGTGILTRHFADRAGRVYAVEPNREMRQMASLHLRSSASVQVLEGHAEATTLPSRSVDLITVAQAIHWFDPESSRTEFLRILKPGGWLALLRNYGTDPALGKAVAALLVPGNGIERQPMAQRATGRPASYTYGHTDILTRTFPFVLYETWESFFGSLCSASCAPDEDHPLYANLERAARRLFAQLGVANRLEVRGETELCLGQVVAS